MDLAKHPSNWLKTEHSEEACFESSTLVAKLSVAGHSETWYVTSSPTNNVPNFTLTCVLLSYRQIRSYNTYGTLINRMTKQVHICYIFHFIAHCWFIPLAVVFALFGFWIWYNVGNHCIMAFDWILRHFLSLNGKHQTQANLYYWNQ